MAKKILVTMGGADSGNVTRKVMGALRLTKISGLKVDVVVGPANPHLAGLRSVAAASGCDMRLTRDAADMPRRMAWADLAVTSGGVTCRESACVGLPTIVGISASNQSGNVRGMCAAGAVVSVGSWKRAGVGRIAAAIESVARDADRRRRLSRAGRALVDGRGAERVLDAMRRKQ